MQYSMGSYSRFLCILGNDLLRDDLSRLHEICGEVWVEIAAEYKIRKQWLYVDL